MKFFINYKWKAVIHWLRNRIGTLTKHCPIEIAYRRPRPRWDADINRFEYQQRYNNFNIRPEAVSTISISPVILTGAPEKAKIKFRIQNNLETN